MQVYVDKKLMGHLDANVTGRYHDVRLLADLPPVSFGPMDPDEAFAPLVYKHIRLTVEWCSYVAANMDISMMGAEHFEEILQRMNVPHDAERILDHATDTVRFRWKTLHCPEELFEEIFDLHNFHPV